MTNLGNIISGISGLASGNRQNFNPIQQPGGITTPQEDYATYGYNENLLADASQFAGAGTGESTMATTAATGSRLGKAEVEGQISDTNAGAILNAGRIGEQASAATTTQSQQSLADLFGNQTLGNLARNAISGITGVGGTQSG